MHRDTLESDFVRSIGILVALGMILFSLQGIIMPTPLYLGYVISGAVALAHTMNFVGLALGVVTLAVIKKKSWMLERICFAFICWFYIMFAFMIVWLVGMQSSGVVMTIVMSVIAGAIYGYITQRGPNVKNSYSRSATKGAVRESISDDHPST